MKLSASVALILGIVGGVLEIVQRLAISMSTEAHTIIGYAIIVVLAFGVVPMGAEALRRLIPAQVAAVLTTAVGILAATVHTFGLSEVLQGIIYFIIAFFAAIGIVPSVVSTEEHAEARAKGIVNF